MSERDSIWWRGFWNQTLNGGETMVNVRLFDMRLQDMIADLSAAEKRTSPGDGGLREAPSSEESLARLTFNSDGEEIGREMAKRIMRALQHDYHWLYTALATSPRKEGEG